MYYISILDVCYMCRNTPNVFPSIIYIWIMKTADQISEFLVFFFLFTEFFFKACFIYIYILWIWHKNILNQLWNYIILSYIETVGIALFFIRKLLFFKLESRKVFFSDRHGKVNYLLYFWACLGLNSLAIF